MTLQTAKNKVKKAIRVRDFANRNNLTSNVNYELVAFNNSYYKLSQQDADKFLAWYTKTVSNK